LRAVYREPRNDLYQMVLHPPVELARLSGQTKNQFIR
jgi:hypothetical protein